MTENEKLDLILDKIGILATDVAELKTDVAGLKTDVAELKTDVAELKADVAGLKTNVSSLNERVATLETDVSDIKQQVTKTSLTIENEIRVNIQRVAEGHLDLSRKLNKCIQISSDIKDKQEIQDIYNNMLTTRLQVVK